MVSKRPTKRGTPPGPVRAAVELRDGAGETVGTIAHHDDVEDKALEWAHLVRTRTRWTATATSRAEMEGRARATLRDLGIAEEAVRRIAKHPLVEVSLLAGDGDLPSRLMPWEMLLSRATLSLRGGRAIFVTRHLDCGHSLAADRTPSSALFVESAPAQLSSVYNFQSERSLVFSGLGLPENVLEQPTSEELAHALRTSPPDIVHFAGVDAHEASRYVRPLGYASGPPASANAKDGYLVRPGAGDEQVQAEVLSPSRLGQVLAGAKPWPLLAAFNFYNSGTRIAAEAVRAGTGAAIGFLDVVDDGLAETFFAYLYRAYRAYAWNLVPAVEWAWQHLFKMHASELVGSGFVLWSRTSLVSPAAGRLEKSAPSRAPAEELTQEEKAPIAVGEGRAIRALVRPEIRPRKHLNYALLHNGRGIFERFRLKKLVAGRIEDVHVEVTLHDGGQSVAFRETLTLDRPVVDLARSIHAPLTSPLGRSLRESVRTTLFAQVSIGGELLYRRTHPVVLLPPDEWRDDEADGPLLPSFVLSRDPAVEAVVDAAQIYLRALADDAMVGFDGYLSGKDRAVYRQVRSIWYALQYHTPLSYVHPPPTFTQDSQRIRTPSQVMQARRGTCIELALLLAACLEHVGIHPVLFLGEGHAFAGYWRSELAHEMFVSSKPVKPKVPLSNDASAERHAVPWQVVAAEHEELVTRVDRGHLVPLETTGITQAMAFDDARRLGKESLKDPAQFESMLDVRLAREQGVTPLPLAQDGAR